MHDHAPADYQPEILAISGSLRTNSYNTQLLQLAAHLAAPAAHMSVWPHLAEVPPFNEDHEAHPPQPVQAMRAHISHADAVLIATPEYNTTLPGQLKTMLDWASRPTHRGVFAHKPTAVIGASLTPYGAQWAQHTVRRILEACGAHLLGDILAIPHADTAFTAHGTLTDPTSHEQLRHLVTELAHTAPHSPAHTAT